MVGFHFFWNNSELLFYTSVAVTIVGKFHALTTLLGSYSCILPLAFCLNNQPIVFCRTPNCLPQPSMFNISDKLSRRALSTLTPTGHLGKNGTVFQNSHCLHLQPLTRLLHHPFTKYHTPDPPSPVNLLSPVNQNPNTIPVYFSISSLFFVFCLWFQTKLEPYHVFVQKAIPACIHWTVGTFQSPHSPPHLETSHLLLCMYTLMVVKCILIRKPSKQMLRSGWLSQALKTTVFATGWDWLYALSFKEFVAEFKKNYLVKD